MKTLKLNDIEDVKAEDLVPGMVLAEGIVIRTERQKTLGNAPEGIFVYTAAEGSTGFAEVGKTLQVYARLNEALTEALVAAFDAASYSSTRDREPDLTWP